MIYSQVIDREKVIKVLSENLKIKESLIRKKVYKNSVREKIKSNVEKDIADRIRKFKLDGVKVDEDYKRVYPYNNLASKVLGFTGGDNQGIIGLEVFYDRYLKGKSGRIRTLTDGSGIEIDGAYEEREEPVAGGDLYISLDVNLQNYAVQACKKVKKEKKAKQVSMILMNPQNGEIYAMANSTSYNLESPRDDKNLLKKYSQSQVNKMSEKEKTKAFNEIWKNPIVSNAFEPGSTYKPFTVAAGLEEGILKGNETYYCDGYQKVGPHTIHCSHRSGHGLITLSQSISLSCNDALMQIASKEGKNVFARYQKNFNFGNKTEIDLPGEAQTASLLHDAKDMTAADLATSSFGQSFNCSMIQMGSAFCSLINGGNYYKPHVVKQLRSSNGEVVSNIEPTLVKQTISKETSDKLRKYMKETVDSGTGTKAKMKDYTAGGKTGTAQKIPRSAGTYIVSFCGFAPVENPQVLVYVVIDEIQRDSQTNTGLAVEIAKKVLEGSLKELNVAKSSKK